MSGKTGPPPVKMARRPGREFARLSASQMAGGTSSRVMPKRLICAWIRSARTRSCRIGFHAGKTEVTPSARQTSTNTGKATRSRSPSGPGFSSGLTASLCAIMKAWLRAIAFGTPVDPLVNDIRATSLAETAHSGASCGLPLVGANRRSSCLSSGTARPNKRYQPEARKAFGFVARAACRRPFKPMAGSGKTTVAPIRHSAASEA